MYKNAPLPENCPPIEAKQPENSITLFRILPENGLNADGFLTYRQLYPENKRYRNLCIAFAVSMFTSAEFAIAANQAAISRNKLLGTHLAELEIQPEHSKYELNPTNGHCSFWFYESCIFERISCFKIIQIDENT